MKVFLLSRRGLAISKVRADYAMGFSMDPAPYGFDAAEHMPGVEITYSDGRSSSSRLSYWTWSRFGIDLPHALINLISMRRADVIWTVLDWEWLAASFLQRVGLLQKKPIIGNSVFIAGSFNSERRSRKALWPFLMTSHVYLTMHSRRAIKALSEVLKGINFHLIEFGISTRAFPISIPSVSIYEKRPIRVYSIGDDPGRDWTCMLEAFGNDARFEVKITCRWLAAVLSEKYTNLSIPRDVTVDDQRAFYEWADIVIMPMKENLYSGISVMCEATAMGKPIVASRTGGADTYFNETEVIYVPVGDPGAMREAVLDATHEQLLAYAHAAQARFLQDDYSSAGMVKRYVAVSKELLARQAK